MPNCPCNGCPNQCKTNDDAGATFPHYSHCSNSCSSKTCSHDGASAPPPSSNAGGSGGSASGGASGGHSAPICPCAGCSRTRCRRRAGGYFSHCGDDCRYAMCRHDGGSATASSSHTPSADGGAAGGGGGGTDGNTPKEPTKTAGGKPTCPCTGCDRPRCSRGRRGGYFSHCGDKCRKARCGH